MIQKKSPSISSKVIILNKSIPALIHHQQNSIRQCGGVPGIHKSCHEFIDLFFWRVIFTTNPLVFRVVIVFYSLFHSIAGGSLFTNSLSHFFLHCLLPSNATIMYLVHLSILCFVALFFLVHFLGVQLSGGYLKNSRAPFLP